MDIFFDGLQNSAVMSQKSTLQSPAAAAQGSWFTDAQVVVHGCLHTHRGSQIGMGIGHSYCGRDIDEKDGADAALGISL